MTGGFIIEVMRKALALALALDDGRTQVSVSSSGNGDTRDGADAGDAADPEEVTRLRAMVSVLPFDPLADGVKSRDDAFYVLGFPPGRISDRRVLIARFRTLATIHHPDSPQGDHQRMSQLNSAMDILKRGAA